VAAERIVGLPALGWIVSANMDDGTYRLWHGQRLETAPDWAVEGVWDAPFPEGGFDQTAQCYGSGVRTRDASLVLVSPGTTTERIFYVVEGRTVHGSNSLPLLMARTGTRLLEDVHDYSARSATSPADPDEPATLPADPIPIHMLAHHNLSVTIGAEPPRRAAKPGNAPFETFEDYERFLHRTADSIAANAHAPERQHQIRLLTTISSGYDSPAAAVMARRMGCTQAVTIAEARSLFPRSDSGADVARQLGLECETYSRKSRGSDAEILFWAGLGHPQDEHFGVFDYPEPVCLLFTGQYGGGIWGLGAKFHSPFVHADWSGLGFREYRLHRSVIHCPVPFWGADRADDVRRISRSDVMKPWVCGGEYDRPVPRRLVEEAGVSREAFGVRKSATHYDDTVLWPRHPRLAGDYRMYLKERGVRAPPVRLARAWGYLYDLVLYPLECRLLGRKHPRRFWPESQGLLFQWANERLADEYATRVAQPADLDSATAS
jgi:hypothetical protein